MSKLQEWGFSKDWWRNQRGEFWVIGQAVLSIGFILLPVVRVVSLPLSVRLGLTLGLGLIGLGLGIAGLFHLGNNLTPLPHPKEDSQLVTTGVYGWVRHPIYSSVIFLALAYTAWQMSLSHGLGAIALFIFFDRKAAQEEQWLAAKFEDYASYRQAVKKLIPFLY
ncbi:isoprenylcysteine carboxylmethyltransferase family protein [uncultured Thermosynechococcus sp.]|uniref:methyltransferase family protein n=3 Tax=uncultured Thermosynechococcus sp. TaxID=436945 RepID=UPI002609B0EA|nr:isoprenylcysteine carboxylmethyltransferase family protein [uncultured Thermosynechococcus sp.]